MIKRNPRLGLVTFLTALSCLAPLPSHAGFLTGVATGVVGHMVVKKIEGAGSEHGSKQEYAKAGRASSSEVNSGLPAIGNGFSACANLFPKNTPIRMDVLNAEWKPKALCFDDFAVLYSGLSKTPMVTVELLNSAKLADAKAEERTDNFFVDARLGPGERSDLADYRGSGYDRGHMAPAGDRPTALAMNQSFALSNMIPQDPTNNRKIWSKIESDVRKYGRRAPGNVYVYSGPIFTSKAGEQKTIGHNQVWVPAQMFKLVYDQASGRSWAYILDNTATAIINPPMDYAQFVKTTGWQLLPQ